VIIGASSTLEAMHALKVGLMRTRAPRKVTLIRDFHTYNAGSTGGGALWTYGSLYTRECGAYTDLTAVFHVIGVLYSNRVTDSVTMASRLDFGVSVSFVSQKW
jgi:hypothetical protein